MSLILVFKVCPNDIIYGVSGIFGKQRMSE